MNSELWKNARQVFNEALERNRNEWDSFLTQACQGNEELRSLVDRLLAEATDDASSQESSWLDSGVSIELVRQAIKPPSLTGKRIGDFQIQHVIGTGGMASVFEAEQQHPRRTVALKVMRWGLCSESAGRRFEYESKVLGSLRHPGIAQVYASGTHHDEWSDQDIPYIAMELVEGADLLTLHVKKKQYDLETTLQLFLKVCQAVHYGHQRGIIHRDLKPQNILVDAQGHPKIIDFGIARATEAGTGERTLQTRAGEILGTLNYMSPEQVDENELDLDLRCDIYSLGVILFELVAGRQPFDFGKKSITTAIQIIQKEAAPRPSQLGGRFGKDSRAIELDWIILKALEKDRDRRYSSVSEFTADITRLLSHEPVLALPPSRIYLAKKFVRRHRIPVIAAVMVLLSLVVAITLTSISLAEARREVSTRIEVNDFLVEILSSASPYKKGREVKVIELLDWAAARANKLYANRPELAGDLHTTLGRIYFAMGINQTALEHFEKAFEIDRKYLGLNHKQTICGIHNLAACHQQLGQLEKADELAAEALTGLRNVLPPEDPEIAKTLLLVAQIAYKRDNLKIAAQAFRQAREIFQKQSKPNSRLLVQACSGLGLTLINLGEDEEGESLLRFSIALGKKDLTEEHPSVLNAASSLGVLLIKKGKNAEAATLIKNILEVQNQTLGKNHYSTITTLSNLAACQLKLGRSKEAEANYRDVISRRRDAGLYKQYDTAISLGNLGVCLESQDKLEAAEKTFSESLSLLEACKIPARHWLTANFRKGLAVVRRKQKRYSEAESLLKDSLEIFMASRGDHRDRIKTTRQALITLYEEWGKPDFADQIRKKL